MMNILVLDLTLFGGELVMRVCNENLLFLVEFCCVSLVKRGTPC